MRKLEFSLLIYDISRFLTAFFHAGWGLYLFLEGWAWAGAYFFDVFIAFTSGMNLGTLCFLYVFGCVPTFIPKSPIFFYYALPYYYASTILLILIDIGLVMKSELALKLRKFISKACLFVIIPIMVSIESLAGTDPRFGLIERVILLLILGFVPQIISYLMVRKITRIR